MAAKPEALATRAAAARGLLGGRRRPGPLPGESRRIGYLYVAPAFLLYAAFNLVPLAQGINISFYRWDGISPGTWVGLANYVESSIGFPARDAFFKDLTLRMGICNARNFITPLMPLIQAGRLAPTRIITHTMPLVEAPRGYAIFDRKEDRAIKVMLKP